MGEGKVTTINSKEEWTAVHQKAGDKAVRTLGSFEVLYSPESPDTCSFAGYCRFFCNLVWTLPHDLSILRGAQYQVLRSYFPQSGC